MNGLKYERSKLIKSKPLIDAEVLKAIVKSGFTINEAVKGLEQFAKYM